MFSKPDGSPYDPDETTRRFERRSDACAAVPRIRFHDMRHTHATLLLESGETAKYVAERLGDTEETVVETYAHVTAKMRSSAVAKVRQFFGPTASAPDDEHVARPSVDSRPAISGDLPVTYPEPSRRTGTADEV